MRGRWAPPPTDGKRDRKHKGKWRGAIRHRQLQTAIQFQPPPTLIQAPPPGICLGPWRILRGSTCPRLCPPLVRIRNAVLSRRRQVGRELVLPCTCRHVWPSRTRFPPADPCTNGTGQVLCMCAFDSIPRSILTPPPFATPSCPDGQNRDLSDHQQLVKERAGVQ